MNSKKLAYCYCLTNYYNGKKLFGITRNPDTVLNDILAKGIIPQSDIDDLDYLADCALGVQIIGSSEDEQAIHECCTQCIACNPEGYN